MEYAAAAEMWRHYCKGSRTMVDAEPLPVLLMFGFAEPPSYHDRFTGDLILDVLGAFQSTVGCWLSAAEDGGGGGRFVYSSELRAMDRRIDALVELRRREQSAGGAR